MTIKEAILEFSKYLKNTDSPIREARLLVCLELGMNMSEIIVNENMPLSEKALKGIEEKVKRRAKGEPFAYISGEKEFMGMRFEVSKSVLIPRDDTEFLVRTAINTGVKGEVLDLCTGSGCVAVSLKKRMEGITVTAVDVSKDALLIAEKNAKANGAEIEFEKKDILKNKIKFDKKFMLVVSNPPYIESKTIEGLDEDVKNYEPILALDGGYDGLDFYKKIVADAPGFLEDGGYLLFEIGYNQEKAVKDIMTEKFENIETVKDYAGHPRVVWGKFKGSSHDHYGHRKRLRERFFKEGLENFQNHEKLEFLLGYAIPRRNVNEIAHRLINKFGGFSRVMDASVEDLMKVGGITESTATLITSIPQFAKAYRMDKWKIKPNLANTFTAGKFMVELFVGSKYEEAYVICLDNMGNLINYEKITEGTINETPLYPRLVVEVALRNKANKVIVAHNHPSGALEPSWNDRRITEKIKIALENIDIILMDHIIVGGERFTSMKEMGLLK